MTDPNQTVIKILEDGSSVPGIDDVWSDMLFEGSAGGWYAFDGSLGAHLRLMQKHLKDKPISEINPSLAWMFLMNVVSQTQQHPDVANLFIPIVAQALAEQYSSTENVGKRSEKDLLLLERRARTEAKTIEWLSPASREALQNLGQQASLLWMKIHGSN